MIEVAVNTILTKAWDNSQALIYFDNSTKLVIQKRQL